MLAISLVYVYFAGSVDKSITSDDIAAIHQLEINQTCNKRSSFQDEVACIKSVQNAIRTLVPNIQCAQRGEKIEPRHFILRGHGCCYDRARFTEKALTYYGYETRHVALYDLESHGLFGSFVPGIDSHATTEVKTSTGWMGVDSNEPFVLIVNDKQAFTYKNLKTNLQYSTHGIEPKAFYNRNLIVVYGLYSRHGMFHGVNLPVPEFNLKELLYNLYED